KQTAKKSACGTATRVKFIHPAHTAFTRAVSAESTSSLCSLTPTPSSRPQSPEIPGDIVPEQWTSNRVRLISPLYCLQCPLTRYHVQYCYLCHDGGNFLFDCKTCPRVVCERCLGLPQQAIKKVCAVDVNFQCPGCHELAEGASKRKKLMPYFAFTRTVHGETIHLLEKPLIMSGVCERSSKSQVSAESTLILHLQCTGMAVPGSLPQLLKTTLEEYHTKESLQYLAVTFDIGTQTKVNRWKAKVKKLGTTLVARRFSRTIIFVTVHSEVTRGDLFAGKGEDGKDVAMEVNEFMGWLFSPPLADLVHASTLVMLTCGPVVSFQESFDALKQSIARLQPEFTLAFTAADFISATLKLFIVSYGVKVLIEGHYLADVLPDLLEGSLALRMHTDVILFHVSGLSLPRGLLLPGPALSTARPLITGYRYSWYHSHRRPWGTSLPMACPKCAAIRPWAWSKVDPQHDSPKARVSKCQAEACGFEVRTQPLMASYKVLRGDSTSGWLKYVIYPADTL
ncbi:hypothetical protein BKA82DRAFT_125352, partial [Pisolithus tinctorius]